jgi:hypothetical protein
MAARQNGRLLLVLAEILPMPILSQPAQSGVGVLVDRVQRCVFFQLSQSAAGRPRKIRSSSVERCKMHHLQFLAAHHAYGPTNQSRLYALLAVTDSSRF